MREVEKVNFKNFIFLQALAKFQTTQKVTTKSGIEQENELLNESAAKETSLNLQIMDLENETKQVSRSDTFPRWIFQISILTAMVASTRARSRAK